MENIVYNELLVRGYNVDVFAKNREGKRVHKQLEVDFVVNQGSQRYYIQVAYDMTSEEKQTQELHSLRNILVGISFRCSNFINFIEMFIKRYIIKFHRELNIL